MPRRFPVVLSVVVALGFAGPVSAADPEPVQAAPAPAPTSVPAPAPAPTVAPAPGDTATPATGTLSEDEVVRLKHRRRQAFLATLGLLGAGGSLVIIGGGIAGGYTTGVVGTKGLWTGVGIFGVGAGVLLTAIIPGVIASRAKKRLLQNGHTVAFTPTGWVARGSGGAGFRLRF